MALYKGIKCTIFEKRSTTVKMEAFLDLVTGKSVIKSMLISSHGEEDICRGLRRPPGLTVCALKRAHVGHCLQ